MQRKTLPFIDAKAGEAGSGTVEGYASCFDDGPDSYGDVIAAGAYSTTIPEFLKDGFIAWSHDWTMPVATPSRAVEDKRGLYIVADFHTDDVSQRARTVTSERLSRGKSMGLSIGYEAVKWHMEKTDLAVPTAWGGVTDELRVLDEIKLYEVSLVAVPAQDSARVTDAKDGLRLIDHEALVHEQVPALITRWRSLDGRGEGKIGAAISRARRERIATLRDVLRSGADDLDALLAEVEPATEDDGKGRLLFAAFLRDEARRLGVAV
jgi:hypothetical protein